MCMRHSRHGQVAIKRAMRSAGAMENRVPSSKLGWGRCARPDNNTRGGRPPPIPWFVQAGVRAAIGREQLWGRHVCHWQPAWRPSALKGAPVANSDGRLQKWVGVRHLSLGMLASIAHVGQRFQCSPHSPNCRTFLSPLRINVPAAGGRGCQSRRRAPARGGRCRRPARGTAR